MRNWIFGKYRWFQNLFLVLFKTFDVFSFFDFLFFNYFSKRVIVFPYLNSPQAKSTLRLFTCPPPGKTSSNLQYLPPGTSAAALMCNSSLIQNRNWEDQKNAIVKAWKYRQGSIQLLKTFFCHQKIKSRQTLHKIFLQPQQYSMQQIPQHPISKSTSFYPAALFFFKEYLHPRSGLTKQT